MVFSVSFDFDSTELTLIVKLNSKRLIKNYQEFANVKPSSESIMLIQRFVSKTI